MHIREINFGKLTIIFVVISVSTYIAWMLNVGYHDPEFIEKSFLYMFAFSSTGFIACCLLIVTIIKWFLKKWVLSK